MPLKATMRSLDEVAAHLPFHVDDLDAANAAFQRWQETGRGEDLELVELWTYCYTRRYFIAKFLRDSVHGPTALDQLVGKAFTKARNNLENVRQPERFASWVSVICRHTFLNFLRRYRGEHAILDEARLPAPPRPEHFEHDRRTTRRAVERAIGRLPPSLQEVARLKFLEDRSYEYIVEVTGRPAASVRAYVNKAVVRLREDPELLALLHEFQT
jgi:RNA polymerase sigma factor (sigma-70 family)